MNIKDYSGVYVFVQQEGGKIHNVSFELIGKARELAKKRNTQVTALLFGHNIEGLTEALAHNGADNIIVVDDPALEQYMTEPYTQALAEIIKEFKPEILLLGATAIGRDLGPRVSARVHTGLTADCTSLDIDEEKGELLMTRPAFGGNIMATIICSEHRPQTATVRPGVMKRVSTKDNKAKVIKKDIPNLKSHMNVEILDTVKLVSKKMDIQDASILVSGGRGMGSPENFKMLEELATLMGGTIASSRATVDAGWVAKDRQVGQTGKTVRPDLYIACGISGAIQHLAGMEESENILAINKDAEALIFKTADFGVVGDATKIIPLVTKEIERRRAER